MLYRISTHWRLVFTVAVLVGLAALALAKGVSVIAEDHGPAGGQPRQTVPAPAAQTSPVAPVVRSGQAAPAAVGSQTTASTPQAPTGTTNHTVATGETLGKIAMQYGVTTAALASANGITNPDLIRVGQKLIIPSH